MRPPYPGARCGSALVLVLVMTLSLAGLAVSAVLLTSSSALVQRFYDKDKDFRFSAQAATALVKATVQRDTTITIPGDSAYRALTAATLTDATGATNSSIKVNGYAAYTGDTAGTYIPFLTVMAQAYDTLGTRSVLRRDFWSESFSRYSMFIDSFPSTVSIALGQTLHGRVHGNRNWVSTTTSPGPTYNDTVTAVGSLSGTGTYNAGSVTGAKRIKWPTTSTLSSLASLATAGSLNFAPVGSAACGTSSGGVDLTGRQTTGGFCSFFGLVGPVQNGTRVRFRPVDVNNNGTLDAAEGFFGVFDLAAGIDTSSLRADISKTTGTNNNIVVQNQCGLMVTIAGRREFYPVARFRDSWVETRVQLSTAPVISAADATTMAGRAGNSPSTAAVNKILGYGTGYSRCFPAGSPYLMLAERYVSAGCAIDSSTASIPYAWGNASGGCGSSAQYGGQDTTFTPNVRRCRIRDSQRCEGTQVRLGNWQAFVGTNTASPPAAVMQAVEQPYLWPISTAYNAASRGVAYASNTNTVFVSDTLRGFLTLHTLGAVVLIDDVVYDSGPLQSGNQCRNFLGIIAANDIDIADNAINRPRPTPDGAFRFLGTPNFTLHGAMMSLTADVGVEGASGSQVTSPALSCNGTNTSGGCVNHTGGVVAKYYTALNNGANTGFVENRSQDPCQRQQANRRPPFFPLTGRYLDYKAYEVDPRDTDTWTEIKTYLARLRGNIRKVP